MDIKIEFSRSWTIRFHYSHLGSPSPDLCGDAILGDAIFFHFQKKIALFGTFFEKKIEIFSKNCTSHLPNTPWPAWHSLPSARWDLTWVLLGYGPQNEKKLSNFSKNWIRNRGPSILGVIHNDGCGAFCTINRLDPCITCPCHVDLPGGQFWWVCVVPYWGGVDSILNHQNRIFWATKTIFLGPPVGGIL